MGISDRVKKVRKSTGLTLEKFGARIGLTRSAISNIESGTRNMSDQAILSICREFGVNEEWLRTGKGNMMQEVSWEQEIANFMNQIAADEPESFRRRLIAAMAKLTPEEWEIAARFAENLAATGAGSVEEDKEREIQQRIDTETEEYRRERLLEEEAAAELFPFSEPDGKRA